MALRSLLLFALFTYVAVIAASPIAEPVPESEKVQVDNVELSSKNDTSLDSEDTSLDDDEPIDDSDEQPDSAGYGGTRKSLLGKGTKKSSHTSISKLSKKTSKITSGIKGPSHKIGSGSHKVTNGVKLSSKTSKITSGIKDAKHHDTSADSHKAAKEIKNAGRKTKADGQKGHVQTGEKQIKNKSKPNSNSAGNKKQKAVSVVKNVGKWAANAAEEVGVLDATRDIVEEGGQFAKDALFNKASEENSDDETDDSDDASGSDASLESNDSKKSDTSSKSDDSKKSDESLESDDSSESDANLESDDTKKSNDSKKPDASLEADDSKKSDASLEANDSNESDTSSESVVECNKDKITECFFLAVDECIKAVYEGPRRKEAIGKCIKNVTIEKCSK